jgi:hypothetical protein
LIKSPVRAIKRIGIAMGAVIISRVVEIEIEELVNDDYSMEKINQYLL